MNISIVKKHFLFNTYVVNQCDVSLIFIHRFVYHVLAFVDFCMIIDERYNSIESPEENNETLPEKRYNSW